MKIFNEITSFPLPLPFYHSHCLFHPISPLFSIQNTLNIACQRDRTPICRNRYEPCRCNSCITCIMNSQLHYTPLYNRIIKIWNHRIFQSQLLLWFTSPAIQFPPHSSGSSRRFEWDLSSAPMLLGLNISRTPTETVHACALCRHSVFTTHPASNCGNDAF